MAEGRTGSQQAVRRLPTGTVTFLITDIEGSTRLLLAAGEAYVDILERHNQIMRETITGTGGMVVSTAGDSVFAVFPGAEGAVRAAVQAQARLAAQAWPAAGSVKVRMGIHTGDGMLGGDDYVGLDVHRAARISAAAHGGQVVLSAATAAAADPLPTGLGLRDLGEHRLKDLVHPERLHQLVGPDLADGFPPLRSGGHARMIVPVQRTSFVPRPEVAALAELLRNAALVTLTGPGGAGKSRLAVQTALEVKDRFADGVVFVDLAAVTHPDLVATAIAGTLGLDVGSAPAVDRVCADLVGQSMLLILDNFEQVLAAADVVNDVLSAGDGLRILVTSRAPLRLRAEQEFPVPPLPVPEQGRSSPAELAGAPAVQLFVQRAARVRPSFSLTADNAAAVARIARRLDGLPLAIELAAARVRSLNPQAIAERLVTGGSTDLAARDRDVPDRQRTLNATIDWSYRLLDPGIQTVFRGFSAFRGGAALEQAEAVLGAGSRDVLADLESLAEHSLVREQSTGTDVRFRMLATINEFAQRQLRDAGEVDETGDRHATAYLALAEDAAPHLTGWSQKEWLDRLEGDHENLRAAFDWALAQRDTERALRFTTALWRFWQIRGHLDEANRRAEAALRLPDLDTTPVRARALEAAGGIAWWRGDLAGAASRYGEALEILRPGGDLAATANAEYNYGLALGFTDRVDEGRALLRQAKSDAEAAADPLTAAWATWGMSDIGANGGDWPLTARAADESLTMFRALDEPFGIGWALFMSAVGLSRMPGGDLGLARQRFREGVRLFAGFRDISAIMMHCWGLAYLEAAEGHPVRAVRLIGAGRVLRRSTGAGLLDANEDLERLTGASGLDLAKESLDPQRYEAILAEALRYSPEEAVALLLDQLDGMDA